MITLSQFNQLDTQEAQALIAPCVNIPRWCRALVAGRPYRNCHHLLAEASNLAAQWQAADFYQALEAHPRIGEQSTGSQPEAGLSKEEQSGVDKENTALAAALRQANERYEACFNQVFLIRARGRSGEEILPALERRLKNTPQQEYHEALTQLREITLIRLAGVISE
ncbi:MAG: Uric acid degradation bifunctional protein PucL [Candidatus Erwinia impunctatus]|nr:Uric acid degradation bifunctional protein PucL [Culicoides impunctatus]